MKCPACCNVLTEIQVGSLRVDVCQCGCGGIWFDAFELQRANEEMGSGDPLLRIQRDERVTVDPLRKRDCPRCAGVKLHRHFFTAKRRVEVDQCPNCAGYWLDAGELARIQAEQRESEKTRQAAQGSISAKFIRYLYRLQTEKRKPL